LKVAVDADDKNFVGQPCCDQLLNNIWYDKMETFQSTLRQRFGLLLSFCTFGLLAPFFISFRQENLPSDSLSNQRKRNYQMTVNETMEEEEEMRKELLARATKK